MWGDWNFKLCNKREGNTESCNCDFQRVFGGIQKAITMIFKGFLVEEAWVWALWWN